MRRTFHGLIVLCLVSLQGCLSLRNPRTQAIDPTAIEESRPLAARCAPREGVLEGCNAENSVQRLFVSHVEFNSPGKVASLKFDPVRYQLELESIVQTQGTESVGVVISPDQSRLYSVQAGWASGDSQIESFSIGTAPSCKTALRVAELSNDIHTDCSGPEAFYFSNPRTERVSVPLSPELPLISGNTIAIAGAGAGMFSLFEIGSSGALRNQANVYLESSPHSVHFDPTTGSWLSVGWSQNSALMPGAAPGGPGTVQIFKNSSQPLWRNTVQLPVGDHGANPLARTLVRDPSEAGTYYVLYEDRARLDLLKWNPSTQSYSLVPDVAIAGTGLGALFPPGGSINMSVGAMDRDGSLYVGYRLSGSQGAIEHFRKGPGGALVSQGVTLLSGRPQHLALSPIGGALFVALANTQEVQVFAKSLHGSLTERSRIHLQDFSPYFALPQIFSN